MSAHFAVSSRSRNSRTVSSLPSIGRTDAVAFRHGGLQHVRHLTVRPDERETGTVLHPRLADRVPSEVQVSANARYTSAPTHMDRQQARNSGDVILTLKPFDVSPIMNPTRSPSFPLHERDKGAG